LYRNFTFSFVTVYLVIEEAGEEDNEDATWLLKRPERRTMRTLPGYLRGRRGGQ